MSRAQVKRFRCLVDGRTIEFDAPEDAQILSAQTEIVYHPSKDTEYSVILNVLVDSDRSSALRTLYLVWIDDPLFGDAEDYSYISVGALHFKDEVGIFHLFERKR